MSCFAGVFRPGGMAADASEVAAMLAPMRARAPDGEQTVCNGPVALAQLFLRTGNSRAEAQNALTLDGEVFICADARIDARQELVAKLRAAGRDAQLDTPHAELVLHAYHVYGEQLVDHLLGDFAFALWDARNGKLVCARDHFGIRPFYYAQPEGGFAFASQPDALLQLPGVSDALDPAAIADFLMFGVCLDPVVTVYTAIRCLPPASIRVVDAAGTRERRYWQLPEECWGERRSEQEYVEQFEALFGQAVADRMPQGPLALQLSGGMDSTSIAAMAAARAASRGEVTAWHVSCNSLAPHDPETRLAANVADALGIRLVVQDVSEHPLLDEAGAGALALPLPHPSAQLALHARTLAGIAETGARVLFSGYGADSVLSTTPQRNVQLLRRGKLLRLAGELHQHLRHTGSLRGSGLRAALRHDPSPVPAWVPARPDWVQPVGDERLDARWRNWWRQYSAAASPAEQLAVPGWARQFEVFEYPLSSICVRYPFLDLRLVRFLLGMPNSMLMRKHVLRRAMQGKLPAEVCARPKAALPVDIYQQLVTGGKIFNIQTAAHACPGVDQDRFAAAWQDYLAGRKLQSTAGSGLVMLPPALEYWMKHRSG